MEFPHHRNDKPTIGSTLYLKSVLVAGSEKEHYRFAFSILATSPCDSERQWTALGLTRMFITSNKQRAYWRESRNAGTNMLRMN